MIGLHLGISLPELPDHHFQVLPDIPYCSTFSFSFNAANPDDIVGKDSPHGPHELIFTLWPGTWKKTETGTLIEYRDMTWLNELQRAGVKNDVNSEIKSGRRLSKIESPD